MFPNKGKVNNQDMICLKYHFEHFGYLLSVEVEIPEEKI